MDRRSFVKTTAGLSGVALTAPFADPLALFRSPSETRPPGPDPTATARIAFVKTRDRTTGVRRSMDLLEFGPVKGKSIFLKPNFNSHHENPGSTHDDTLAALVKRLQAGRADRVTVGDRSGMGDTAGVMRRKGVFRMADELGFETVVFDELDQEGWELLRPEGSHWNAGFAIARPALDADGVIQTCCLKTHRYGGHFTMSLKNSVGLAAKRVPGESYNYMRELHSSPDQRRMIAEINLAYSPDLVVLDGVEAFVDGGPDKGKKVDAEVVLAGTDRVALDAVGVAILRHFGTTPEVSEGRVFEQEQLARAVELGLGVDSPEKIELVTDDPASREYAGRIREVLLA
jgi:uncharacterized protein (DUF362 family)